MAWGGGGVASPRDLKINVTILFSYTHFLSMRLVKKLQRLLGKAHMIT